MNCFTTTSPVIAQTRCRNDHVPASTTTRQVQLPQFGVQITLPDNFRIVTREDDSIAILDPFEFNHLQCLKQGIPVLGQELEFESFRLTDNPERLSAMEYAQKFTKNYCQQKDLACSVANTISKHTINGIAIVIVEVSHGYELSKYPMAMRRRMLGIGSLIQPVLSKFLPLLRQNS